MGFIYIATCNKTNKQYVGQTTKTVERRWEEHQQCARRVMADTARNPDQTYLHRAMAKHGIESFHVQTVLKIDDEFLNEYEETFIHGYNTLVPNGYNLTSGGKQFAHSESSIKAMSSAKCKNVDKQRHEKLRGLPPHVRYCKGKTYEAIAINNHPLCKYQTFSTVTYGSFENVRQAVIAHIAELEGTDTSCDESEHDDSSDHEEVVERVYKPKRKNVNLEKRPNPRKTKNGYRVQKTHKGIVYTKAFIDTKKTDEEKLALAEEYCDEIMNFLRS